MSGEERDDPKKITLPAFGLADEILAQLEAELNLKKGDSSEEPVTLPPDLPPVDPRNPARIVEFATLLEDFSQQAEREARREEEVQLVAFYLDREEYALPIQHVREIVRVGTFTRVPEAPEHVRGVMNLRGKILPVVELRTRLGMGPLSVSRDSRIVVVEAYGKTIGLLVDRVTQIVKVFASALAPPPEEILPPVSDYLTAVVKMEDRLVLLLDAEKVLILPKRRV